MTNEMTAEEAVKILRFEQEQVEHRLDGCSDTQENRNIYEAFRMAIQALEQQPRTNLAKTSQDCISRTELLAKIDEERKHLLELKMDGAEHIIVHHARRIIEDMPSVTPQYTDEEIDKIQAVEQAYVDKMVELAVEETKRPKGKWIHDNCSICGYGVRPWNNTPYCPHCGSYNAENKENEGK